MKKIVLALATISAAAGAFAQTTAPTAGSLPGAGSPTQVQLELLHEDLQQLVRAQLPAQDPRAFCYFDGRPYSIGARHGDQVCVASSIRTMVSGDQHDEPPLRWVSASDAAHGNY